jgi:4-hydroxy-tetrahydrodipicolinate synthase
MSVNLGHLITAMITPFDEHNRVNYEMAVTLGNHLIKNGTDCILASGTTGECPTLTHEEESLLFEVLVHELNAPIMAGTGSNCTAVGYL